MLGSMERQPHTWTWKGFQTARELGTRGGKGQAKRRPQKLVSLNGFRKVVTVVTAANDYCTLAVCQALVLSTCRYCFP